MYPFGRHPQKQLAGPACSIMQGKVLSAFYLPYVELVALYPNLPITYRILL